MIQKQTVLIDEHLTKDKKTKSIKKLNIDMKKKIRNFIENIRVYRKTSRKFGVLRTFSITFSTFKPECNVKQVNIKTLKRA